MGDSTPSSSTVSRTVLLLLRVLTFLFLLIALILIAIDTYTDPDTGEKTKFNDVYAYRYMFSTIILGFVYTFLQMAFSIFTVVSGNRVLSGDGGYLFDFFGDKIISYLLLSGSAAGFGFTVELHRADNPLNSFTGKANASASLLLIGFLFTAIASTFTSFALPKKAN
ncbi:CASP protein 4D1 [Spatholobus suberectus]|nr:CASP protein 4D1 [Spatholobus suberectus]